MTDVRGAPIHAVIGVRRDGPETWYLRRSQHMTNYKGVWSLPSIKYDPAVVTDMEDMAAIRPLFDQLSAERLGGVPVRVGGLITSGSSDMNPMGVEVTLHLYHVDFAEPPTPAPRYYVEEAWMTASEYNRASAGQPCGLCTRLWGDFAWLMGWADMPFVPTA